MLREEGHIAIEIAVERLPPGPRALLRRIVDGFGALVCAVLCYYALRTFWRSYSAKNLVQETFVFPEWYLYVIAPPIFLILMLLFLRRVLRPLPGAFSHATAPAQAGRVPGTDRGGAGPGLASGLPSCGPGRN